MSTNKGRQRFVGRGYRHAEGSPQVIPGVVTAGPRVLFPMRDMFITPVTGYLRRDAGSFMERCQVIFEEVTTYLWKGFKLFIEWFQVIYEEVSGYFEEVSGYLWKCVRLFMEMCYDICANAVPHLWE